MRPDVADAPECAMTDRSAAMAETVFPAISRYFLIFPWLSALAGRANFGEMGDLIDHQSGIATDRANQRGGAWRNCRAI
jgi:hypothetical protein